MSATARPVGSVSVRELVEFVLRTGDLGGDGGFASLERARAGLRGQQQLQRARPPGYQTETPIACELETDHFMLRIQGRMDGFHREGSEVLIEEIKTVVGQGQVERDPLHWAQVKMYAAIYARLHAEAAIEALLTYLNLETGAVTEFREKISTEDSRVFFEQVTGVYLEWAAQEQSWRAERDRSIQNLSFPYSDYRPGQRPLAVAVYRTLARSGRLFVEAPTGIGKTMSVLFPSLKALGEGRFARLFYLTAKTPGRTVAEKALEDLRRSGLRLRAITLTAKDKICFNQGQPCDLKICPFAVGYYDRVKPALRATLAVESMTRTAVEAMARQHQVCPFELSLDAALWADVIIGDYNYAFDPSAYLKRFFAEETEDCAFLIDEAHNLVDRAREMYSASLEKSVIREVKRAMGGDFPAGVRALNQVSRKLSAVMKPTGPMNDPARQEDQSLGGEASSHSQLAIQKPDDACSLFGPGLQPVASTSASDRQTPGAIVRLPVPSELLPPLQHFLKTAESWLMLNRPAAWREALLELYFQVTSFLRVAEQYDEHYVTLLEPGRREARIRLFCLDPSAPMRQVLTRACRAAIFFSATLTPLEYFRDLLGGESNDKLLQLTSPFPPENLRLLVHGGISTRYRDRTSTFEAVARSIAALIQARQGNYIVYFPSYEYLNQVRERFAGMHPQTTMLAQTPGMTEIQREEFLAAFRADHEQTLIGFAVMGGIFGEGIDLVGERLVGAIIVGVGLPQLCLERDLMRDFFQARGGAGFDFAYTFPGMNRVLQAAGRVIRSENDRGIVLLVDTRFRQTRYRSLFASWWQPVTVRGEEEISRQAAQFWRQAS